MTNKCTKHCSPLTRTQHLQKVFDNPVPDKIDITADKLNNCYSQIEEELDELSQIIADLYFGKLDKDSKELVDEVSDVANDLIEYIQQMVIQCGLKEKVERDSYAIYENNLTKVCKTEEDARKTLEMYLEKGVECEATKNFEGDYVVKRVSDGKVMKPWDFKSVEL